MGAGLESSQTTNPSLTNTNPDFQIQSLWPTQFGSSTTSLIPVGGAAAHFNLLSTCHLSSKLLYLTKVSSLIKQSTYFPLMHSSDCFLVHAERLWTKEAQRRTLKFLCSSRTASLSQQCVDLATSQLEAVTVNWTKMRQQNFVRTSPDTLTVEFHDKP